MRFVRHIMGGWLPALFGIAVLLVSAAAPAAITVRGASQAFLASGAITTAVGAAVERTTCGDITPAIPAGAVGDLLIAQVIARRSAATVTMTGWNVLFADNNAGGAGTADDLQSILYWRSATSAAANGDPRTISQSGTCEKIYARITRFGNVDTAQPLETSSLPAGNWVFSLADNIDTGTQNVSVADSMLMMATFIADNVNVTTPLDWNDLYDNADNSGDDTGISLMYRYEATTGLKGPVLNLDMSGTDVLPNHGVLFAVRPAPSANLVINVPAGTVDGDVMIATVAFGPCTSAGGSPCTPTVTAPAGWTLVDAVDQTTGGSTGNRMAVYRRVASSEPASYTWAIAGTPKHIGAVGGIVGFVGVNTTLPIVVSLGQATASGTSHTASQIDTGAVTDTMLVSSHAANSSANWTPPAGMTEQVDVASLTVRNNSGISLQMNTQSQAAAGLTGVRTASFTGPAPTADTGTTHMLALRVAGFAHYAITAPTGTAFATCNDIAVNIKAHDSSHVIATTPPAGTVINLSTSIGSGTWQVFSAGAGDLGIAGNFVPSGADNGLATYTWAGTETELQVRLRVTTATSFNVNVTDGTRSEDAADDPVFSVADSTVEITADGTTPATVLTQIAGKPSNTGWNAQTLFVRVLSSDKSASCSAAYQGQTLNVEFAAVCEDPATCSGAPGTEFQVLNNASSYVSVAKNNGPGAPATTTPVPLTFNASGLAPLVFRYGDAGQVKLYARVPLPAPPANKVAVGTTNSFVVRPFGIAFRGADAATAIAHSTTEAGTLLAAAGDNFTMTLGAYKWATGQDGDNDGVPDSSADLTGNGLTPNFAATTTVAVDANLPGVAAGAVRRGVACAGAAIVASGEWSLGAATISDWCYSEAGNARLTAAADNYLTVADADIAGSSGYDGTGAAGGYVGRFRPKHFALDTTITPPTLTNRAASSCAPASSFTYMGEGIGLTFRLVAQNTQLQTTQNYVGVYAKLNPAAASVYDFGARSGGTNLTSRLTASYAGATPAWSLGVLNIPPTDRLLLNVGRATPDAPDGPYTGVAFGIAPVDSDSVALNTLDFDADGNAVNERRNLGVSTEVRFGRLRMGNANGSQLVGLPVPIETQYWNGTSFITNTADSCTALAPANIAMSGYTQNLGACETSLTIGPFSSGRATLRLSAPGSGNNGSALLTPNLGTTASGSTCVAGVATTVTAANRGYLQGRWDAVDQGGDTLVYDDNPVGRATFGVYRGSYEIIYFRENF